MAIDADILPREYDVNQFDTIPDVNMLMGTIGDNVSTPSSKFVANGRAAYRQMQPQKTVTQSHTVHTAPQLTITPTSISKQDTVPPQRISYFKDALGNEYKIENGELYTRGWQNTNLKIRLINEKTNKVVGTDGKVFQVYGWHLVNKIDSGNQLYVSELEKSSNISKIEHSINNIEDIVDKSKNIDNMNIITKKEVISTNESIPQKNGICEQILSTTDNNDDNDDNDDVMGVSNTVDDRFVKIHSDEDSETFILKSEPTDTERKEIEDAFVTSILGMNAVEAFSDEDGEEFS